MKPSLKTALLFALFLALVAPRSALAVGSNDAGASGDAGAAGALATDAGTGEDAGPDAGMSSDGVPLRCDGGLCDTTTGGTPCSFRGRIGTDGSGPIAVALFLAAIGVGRRARRAKRQAR
ncbi:MAG TPA: hypothetical protein VNW92_05160 [Polyangiaceae bacterium]|jgi:hypothetical protein|nr:hypothetical protein [Polyangiaceae bacterium]